MVIKVGIGHSESSSNYGHDCISQSPDSLEKSINPIIPPAIKG